MITIQKQIALGGNTALFVIPASRIHSILGDTIFYSGEDPTIEIECAPESIRHTCKTIQTRAGFLYDHAITAFLAGINPDSTTELAKLNLYNNVLVVIRNSAGTYFLIGNTNESLNFNFNFDSAANPSDRIGSELTISGQLTTSFAFIQMPLVPV
ncbi:MAG: hypothetical protein WCI92_18105 [Bacteroidota bacterium]